jgi:hypothetical protein
LPEGDRQNKEPGSVVVCNVPGRRLDHKCQEAADARKEPHLGEGEAQVVDKKREQGR